MILAKGFDYNEMRKRYFNIIASNPDYKLGPHQPKLLHAVRDLIPDLEAAGVKVLYSIEVSPQNEINFMRTIQLGGRQSAKLGLSEFNTYSAKIHEYLPQAVITEEMKAE